jgi:hypothetical protein
MAASEPPRPSIAPRATEEVTLRATTDYPPSLRRPSSRPSRLSIYDQLFKPRWKPWSPQKVVAFTMAFGLIMGSLVVLFPKLVSIAKVHVFRMAPAAPTAPDEPEVTVAPVTAPERADAALVRKGRSPLAGGLLTLPAAFSSPDGRYDLVLHFHGNTDLVEESYNRLPLNAVVVIMNLGNGSGRYEDRFANPLSLPEILGRVQATMEKRGLRNASQNRLALAAWSAGYGAVIRTLEQPALADQVDSVVLLDGIHCGYKPHTTTLLLERIAPFERFAREAMAGKKLFSITHSEITPIGNYAGTRATTDALLQLVDVPRTPGGVEPPPVTLTSIEGVIAKKSLRPLLPRSEAHSSGFHVRGYAGDQPEHHTMHLIEMSETAMPDLVRRWAAPTGSSEPPLPR